MITDGLRKLLVMLRCQMDATRSQHRYRDTGAHTGLSFHGPLIVRDQSVYVTVPVPQLGARSAQFTT
jgi:hypothetical protein